MSETVESWNALGHEEITKRALKQIESWTQPILIRTDIMHVIGLVSLLQLALRHPQGAESSMSRMVEQMIRQLVEDIDPGHGDLYKFLQLGFDPECDQPIAPVSFTDDQLCEVFRKIAANERQHGGFLTDFSKCFVRADPENRPLLRSAAIALANKYKLWDYRHDADAITAFPPGR